MTLFLQVDKGIVTATLRGEVMPEAVPAIKRVFVEVPETDPHVDDSAYWHGRKVKK